MTQPSPSHIALDLVARVALSPSVHNVQPARWRFGEDDAILFEDTTRRIPAGDPTGRDTLTSLGSAVEGLSLTLSTQNLGLSPAALSETPGLPPHIRPVTAFRFTQGVKTDPLYPFLAQRYSHRGGFAKVTDDDRVAVEALTTDDISVIGDPLALKRLGQIYDDASMRFFRDNAFRAELVSWMRLSPKHPRWRLDGLNAEAMALSGVEATGASLVLGPTAFPLLDRIGLAGPLTAESAKVTGATAVLVLHRPATEDGLETGRAFHRAWLRFTAAGFVGAVMAALADDDASRAELTRTIGMPAGRRIVTTFRIGRGNGTTQPKRARLDPRDLLV